MGISDPLSAHGKCDKTVRRRTVATELTVFSDYYQIHLLDSESSSELADEWSSSPLPYHLALADDAIGIVTGVNGDVAVTIDTTDGPPAEDKDTSATVSECSLRADSGAVRLSCPTYGDDDGDLVTVPNGWLRLRVSLTREPHSGEEYGGYTDDPADRQHVRIQCWPAEPSDPVLLKGWNPETSSFH